MTRLIEWIDLFVVDSNYSDKTDGGKVLQSCCISIKYIKPLFFIFPNKYGHLKRMVKNRGSNYLIGHMLKDSPNNNLFNSFVCTSRIVCTIYRSPCIHKGTNLIFHDFTTICVRRYTTLIILGIIETYAITQSFIKEAYFET